MEAPNPVRASITRSLFVRVFEAAPVATAVVGGDGVIIRANRAMSALTGQPVHALVDIPVTAILVPDHHDAWAASLRGASATTQSTSRAELQIRCDDGIQRWVDASIGALGTGELVLQMIDITPRIALQQRLQHLSDHDPLTGLPNRRRFESELRAQLSRCQRYGPSGALLICDIDDFKAVNDRYGHHAGDTLLIDLAHTIQSAIRDTDTVARLGGDEFALLLPYAARADAEAVASKLVRLVSQRRGSPTTRATVSIGATVFNAVDRVDVAAHIARADAAMYAAKSAGKNTYRIDA